MICLSRLTLVIKIYNKAPGFMEHTAVRSNDTIGYLLSLTTDKRTGEVLFQSGKNSAKVYLQDGLVVWAFATGQKESFQSILLKENQIPKDKLLSGIQEARKLGKKSLNEILCVLGIENSNERNLIIERHTRAALGVIRDWTDCVAQFNKYTHTPETDTGPKGMGLGDLVGTIRHTNGAPRAANLSSYKTELTGKDVGSIDEALNRFRMEIPHFVAAMIIDTSTGMPIETTSDAMELDVEAVSAYYRDLNRSALDALEVIGKNESGIYPLEEILITSKEDFVMLRTLNDGEQLLYLLFEKKANTGRARVVVRKYIDQLSSFLT